MNNETDPNAALFLLARMWMDVSSKMAAAAMTSLPDATPPEAARQMRGSIFETMSGYTEEYLRSPQFLDTMKQTLDGVIAWRKQVNDAFIRFHQSVHSASREDIDNLMLTVQHMEKRMLDRLDTLSVRMEELGRRLDDNDRARSTGTRSKRSGGARSAASEPAAAEKGNGRAVRGRTSE